MRVVIIGNGIAGTTAARHLRKLDSDVQITMISAETDHFFSRTALMYIYMGHLKFEDTKPYEDHFWSKNRIELVKDYVTEVKADKHSLSLKSGREMQYDKLIIACGSTYNKFGWPGQDLKGVQGLYSYQDLQELEENTHSPFATGDDRKVKRAVVVGGGLIGVELAEMLHTRNIEVTFLVREKHFWGNVLPPEEGDLVVRHMRRHHVDLRFETELDSIVDNGSGRVQAITTKAGETIECELVGLTAGVRPNVGFLKESGLEIERGIMVDEHLKTSWEDVYAIGDCAQLKNPPAHRRNMEQVWYVGRMMGQTVAPNVLGQAKKYNPGHWFNSAKFFDIEYQTYGKVPGHAEDGQTSFYWEHEDGEKCIKMVFREDNKLFLGINTFGIRLRHEVCESWLDRGLKVNECVEELEKAHFDPEFYDRHYSEIAEKFNKDFSEMSVKVPRKKVLGIF